MIPLFEAFPELKNRLPYVSLCELTARRRPRVTTPARGKHMKHAIRLTTIFLLLLTVALTSCGKTVSINDLSNRYIERWREFYPSRALAAGDVQAAFRFEDLAPEKIGKWLQFNREILSGLDGVGEFAALPLDDRIDARLLKRQILLELETWQQDKPHEQSASYYSELASQAVTHILARNQMNPSDTLKAVSNRLKGIVALCRTGLKNLKNGSPQQTEQSAEQLETTAEFYEKKLPEIAGIQQWLDEKNKENFKARAAEAARMIRQLASYIRKRVMPRMTLPDAMGKKNYNRKLKLYTDSSLTAGQMEQMALAEIEQVREIMAKSASKYWETTHPDTGKPAGPAGLMNHALEAMESHRAGNQQEFLEQFKALIQRAFAFVKEKEIATVTGKPTIYTALSPPHFAGAAVGGVYPSGPFQPEADTLFYLPTVPDSAPGNVKEGFYRSFNNHFNEMIITHEIVPGHYWHLKLAARHPRRVRALFGGDVFAEGWATLCEQITIEKGWGNNDPLTYLAHLRKRLENAVRAYTSVQVHCKGWNKAQLTAFAVERGLLAPQFAANLWDRVIFSPHQLTSYFLGYKTLDRLLKQEQKRPGKDFRLKNFCDTILNAGAMPMDLLPLVLRRRG
jgi:uncharacterized protein (DUF885 family)